MSGDTTAPDLGNRKVVGSMSGATQSRPRFECGTPCSERGRRRFKRGHSRVKRGAYPNRMKSTDGRASTDGTDFRRDSL